MSAQMDNDLSQVLGHLSSIKEEELLSANIKSESLYSASITEYAEGSATQRNQSAHKTAQFQELVEFINSSSFNMSTSLMKKYVENGAECMTNSELNQLLQMMQTEQEIKKW